MHIYVYKKQKFIINLAKAENSLGFRPNPNYGRSFSMFYPVS
jgi:hypothetical protein